MNRSKRKKRNCKQLYKVGELSSPYGTKKQAAIRAAKKKLAEGDIYESITVIADNGEELLDETEIRI